MTTTCTMILGDCLEVMPDLKKRHFHLCLTDFPYGLTSSRWDTPINLSVFFGVWSAVRTTTASSIHFANLSHLQKLIEANKKEFRYELVWAKTRGTHALSAAKRPMPSHEFIAVFGRPGAFYISQREPSSFPARIRTQVSGYNLLGVQRGAQKTTISNDSSRHPLSVRVCAVDNLSRNGAPANANTMYHPTQKPVALLSWIISGYSEAHACILDPCAGSGSSAVSAIQNGRNVTCIEKDQSYFEASVERVKKAIHDGNLDATVEVRR